MIGDKQANFIIIDDSELECFVTKRLVKYSGMGKAIECFLEASEALNYIKQKSNSDSSSQTIILLDILMPIMSGARFVEEFEKLPLDIQARYTIVAFTSSMNKKDTNEIKSFKSVKHLFDKPLSPEALMPLMEEL